MSDSVPATPPIDLSNCDREPIHIPGAIQPHGALLAFTDDGRLAACSQNAEQLLGALPAVGAVLTTAHLDELARTMISAAVATVDPSPEAIELSLNGSGVDLILHRAGALTIAEFEPRCDDAPALERFAVKAQQALQRLQRQRGLDALLATAVQEIRTLTGFDRVMAYRFRHDDAGDVVAEARRDDLEPFLGMRYPASDIPAQARRLYTINPLRLIADLRYVPVPIAPAMVDSVPIDLSHSVLRSVSPIHVEYLCNMGVAASMSISIIVGERLWGLFACHHMSARHVPHAVRMACQLLSQVVSVLVERADAGEMQRIIAHATELQHRLVEHCRGADDILRALCDHESSVVDLLAGDSAAVTLERRVQTLGDAPPREAVAALVGWLHDRPDDLFVSHRLSESLPPALAAMLPGVCGMLAIRYYREQDGYLLWFRGEEVETARWAGNPQKHYSIGPNGPRLTPRGSFAEWRQTVRGQAVPWSSGELEVAARLRRDLQEIMLGKITDIERARELFIATLGHDLRNPLNAISMSAQLLSRDDGQSSAMIGKRIASSSHRIQRLVDDLLDLSRLQRGLGLGLQPRPVDLAELLLQLVVETRAAFPGQDIRTQIAPVGTVLLDADRIAQVISNLLSNARHHGTLGRPISIRLSTAGPQRVQLEVGNQAPPIPAGAAASLFQPFKGSGADAVRNRIGLGLGLYIAAEIVRGHGGQIRYAHRDEQVVFTVELPMAATP
ncbi:ATP-binding protein [Solimonas marina]|uniref:histidine kinase n=1 Tax=Solimonas marina TaxID=2714601 RepID=A0A970B737_9GAMM|nr:ATP-binding protein [Solimonas marina]NKF23468.1 GAF domain-containing protein [Solimonas marina]